MPRACTWAEWTRSATGCTTTFRDIASPPRPSSSTHSERPRSWPTRTSFSTCTATTRRGEAEPGDRREKSRHRGALEPGIGEIRPVNCDSCQFIGGQREPSSSFDTRVCCQSRWRAMAAPERNRAARSCRSWSPRRARCRLMFRGGTITFPSATAGADPDGRSCTQPRAWPGAMQRRE